MRLRTRLGAVAATVLAASGIVLAVPGTAQAGAYGCKGTFIRSIPVPTDWRVLSDIRLYYNSSSGYSCAVNVKRRAFRDIRTRVDIQMINGTWLEDNVRPGVNEDRDGGKFKWYAGPVRVKGRNLTVTIWASTDYRGEKAHTVKTVKGDRR